jgi:hypothetical protein
MKQNGDSLPRLRRKAWTHDGGLAPCSPQCAACEAERRDIQARLERERFQPKLTGTGLGHGSARHIREGGLTVLLTLALLVSPASSATLATEVGGAAVREAGEIPMLPEAAIQAARSLGLAEGFRVVADQPGDWRRFVLVHDSTMTWPAGFTLFLSCDSTEVPATQVFAMTPPLEQRVVRLGGWYGTRLDPNQLWRVRSNRGTMATILFARFPFDSCRGVATSLRAGHTRTGGLRHGIPLLRDLQGVRR